RHPGHGARHLGGAGALAPAGARARLRVHRDGNEPGLDRRRSALLRVRQTHRAPHPLTPAPCFSLRRVHTSVCATERKAQHFELTSAPYCSSASRERARESAGTPLLFHVTPTAAISAMAARCASAEKRAVPACGSPVVNEMSIVDGSRPAASM